MPVEDNTADGFTEFSWYGPTLSTKVWHTTVDNVSYDVAVDTSRNYIYSTSWGGGLRRFNYIDNPEWEVIPLPMDNQDSLFCEITSHYNNYVFSPVDPPDGSDNHKAFSIYIDLNTVWVGTAGGINKGLIQENQCIDWIHYNVGRRAYLDKSSVFHYGNPLPQLNCLDDIMGNEDNCFLHFPLKI